MAEIDYKLNIPNFTCKQNVISLLDADSVRAEGWYLCDKCCKNAVINYILHRNIFTPLIKYKDENNHRAFDIFSDETIYTGDKSLNIISIQDIGKDDVKRFDFFYGRPSLLNKNFEHVVPRTFYKQLELVKSLEELDIATSLYYSDQHNVFRGDSKMNSLRSSYVYKNIDKHEKMYGSIIYNVEELQDSQYSSFLTPKVCSYDAANDTHVCEPICITPGPVCEQKIKGTPENIQTIYSKAERIINQGGGKNEIKIGKQKIELPDESKGMAARAFFYILFTYGPDIFIDDLKDKHDRSIYFACDIVKQMIEWNKNKPENMEKSLSTKKTIVQGNTNPFIDEYDVLNIEKMILFKKNDEAIIFPEHTHISIKPGGSLAEEQYLLSQHNIKISDFLDLFVLPSDERTPLLLKMGYIKRSIKIETAGDQLKHLEAQSGYKLKEPVKKSTLGVRKPLKKVQKKSPELPAFTAENMTIIDDRIKLSNTSIASNNKDDIEKNLKALILLSKTFSGVISQEYYDKINLMISQLRAELTKKENTGGYYSNTFLHHCY